MSVGFHLVSEGSYGLYHQAIMESNPLSLPVLTVQGANLLRRMLCVCVCVCVCFDHH